MPGRTDAQKRAHINYISKFARLEIRTTAEQRDMIQAHATARNESVNAFINRAIREAIERDNAAQETKQEAGE